MIMIILLHVPSVSTQLLGFAEVKLTDQNESVIHGKAIHIQLQMV
jgi:hypothetical protein